MKIGTYERVSTDAQDFASQRHDIDAWLAQRGLTPVAQFSDKLSGKSDERPGLDNMKAAIADGTIDTVVVYRLDRLSRKATDALGLLLDWIRADVGFYAVNQPILSLGIENPMRLTIAALFSELAEMERKTIISRVLSGLAAARKKGVKFGRKPSISKRKRERARLLKADGKTYAEIGELLNISASSAHQICKRKEPV